MAIPKFEDFFQPVLAYFNNQNIPITRRTALEEVTKIMSFSQEDLSIMTAGKTKPAVLDRIEWSIVYLRKAELIETVSRGVYQITDSGRSFLEKYPIFYRKELENDTPFSLNMKIKSTSLNTVLIIDKNSEEPETSLDEVDLALITQDLDLNTEILNALEQWGNNTVEKGKFFENLCLELLLKMKYGIDGEVVGGSGDKGVDIILKIDKLGFEKIGVQCKCYKDTPVPSKDIAYFESGLKKKGLVKGIFITTSRFSKEALLDIERNPNIIPIDSNLLVELMKDYEVGVRSETKKIYILDIKEG